MKDYVGKKVKGFKFKNFTNGVKWNEDMESYIGKVGQVLSQLNGLYVVVQFDDDETWTYPISLVEANIVEEDELTIDKELKGLMIEFLSWKKEKEEQKESLIEMMRLDEEAKLYKEHIKEVESEIIKECIKYADKEYFIMHEDSVYKALQQGFEAGAKWGIAQQNK
jgi:hypothetical protein